MSVPPDAPRRTHSASLYLGLIRSAPSTLLGLPAFLAVTTERGGLWIVGVALAGFLVTLLLSWLAWQRRTYAVAEDAFVLEHGIVSRTRRALPFERIQDVSIEQGALARLFGLATVRVETGGGEGEEGKLEYVSLEEARRLRTVLRGVQDARVAASRDEARAPDEPAETIVYRIGFARLLLFGVFNFSLLWMAAIFGLLQFADEWLGFGYDDAVALGRSAAREIEARFSWQAAATIAGLTLLLGVLAGVVRAVARDFGYRITYQPGRFRRIHGLVARSETVIAIRRIQLGLIKRGPIAGAFGWRALSVQTLGGSVDPSGHQRLAPFATAGEASALLALAGLPGFDRAALRPVARARALRLLIREALIPVLAICTLGWFVPWALLALGFLPLAVAHALLARARHRFALGPESLQVADGVLVREEWILPYRNAQTVTIRRGPFQQWLGLATVAPDTAGAGALGRPHIRDLRLDDAAALARALLERT